ncbi:MAG: metallophosphoesterase [Elusimicrobiales bacterium]|nr:metallophosphoesterase [Elusimicrobiales bacterium]
MRNPFSVFGMGLSLFCLAFNLYAAWWVVRRLALRHWGRFLAVEAALLLSALYPAARGFFSGFAGPLADASLWLGFFVLGASFIVFWWLALCDLLLWALRARGRGAALACLAGAAGLVGLAAWQGHKPPEVVRLEIPVAGLPRALDGFSVLQVSDLHLGRMSGHGRIAHIAGVAEGVSPDLIVFTGDFSERRERMPDGTCETLRSLKARYGRAAVLGNHDLFTGGGPAAEFFTACGVKMLRGEVYEPARGLLVAGVDDLRRGDRDGAARLAPLLDRAKPLILLSHQPEGFDAITAAGAGLVLSGHTHNGQIFPFNLLEFRLFKYFYGLYRERGFHIYVTSGAGTWGPPLRLFTRSELPLLTLRYVDSPGGKR